MAAEALGRIDEGAYANLVLPPLLDASALDARDRGFVTELVYGTTRMQRACDWLVDRFVMRPLDPAVRVVLRLGAYQLVFLQTPPHAAVSATVAVAPPRARGLVNAVLRRVAEAGQPVWPDDGVALSYPDWVIARLDADLGHERSRLALATMNRAPVVTVRDDGYTQDLASQWVAAYVGARPGDRVADLCAAPGGKATLLARAVGAGGGRGADGSDDGHLRPAEGEGPGGFVVAADLRPGRADLVAGNARRLGQGNVAVIVSDGRYPSLRPGQFDRVLVDAPCSGLGVLRRRPDARWRIRAPDVDILAALQRHLLDGGAGLVRPGGTLVYSVCTLTVCETTAVDEWMAVEHPEFEALERAAPPWEAAARGARLLPQTADTDGMFVVAYRRRAGA